MKQKQNHVEVVIVEEETEVLAAEDLLLATSATDVTEPVTGKSFYSTIFGIWHCHLLETFIRVWHTFFA